MRTAGSDRPIAWHSFVFMGGNHSVKRTFERQTRRKRLGEEGGGREGERGGKRTAKREVKDVSKS